ncbi:hypothetical protein WAI453_007503 [Rhynchosporium graminicola]
MKWEVVVVLLHSLLYQPRDRTLELTSWHTPLHPWEWICSYHFDFRPLLVYLPHLKCPSISIHVFSTQSFISQRAAPLLFGGSTCQSNFNFWKTIPHLLCLFSICVAAHVQEPTTQLSRQISHTQNRTKWLSQPIATTHSIS